MSSLSSSAIDVSLCVALFEVFAFVVSFLPSDYADLDLHILSKKVKLQRYDRESFRGRLVLEFPDLAAVKQEFPFSSWFVRLDGCVFVGADVRADEPGLSTFDLDVAVYQICSASSERLDLTSLEDHSRFDTVEDLVVMTRATVHRD